MRDVAEATGLSEAEVLAQIRQIRAEAAFTEPKAAPAPSPLPWIAVGALVVAVGVTGWRMSLGDGMPTFEPIPNKPIPAPPPTTTTTVRTQPAPSMMVMSGGGSEHMPPPGLEVHAMGQTMEYMLGGYSSSKTALRYDRAVGDLVAAASESVQSMDGMEHDPNRFVGRPIPPAGTKYRDTKGNLFLPRPGYARVIMTGWAGTEVGWVKAPLDAAGIKALKQQAERLLKDAKKEQDDALSPVADPSTGVVAPPPGYFFRFAGRRLDFQEGPRISFAGMSRAQVVARLSAALMNAVYRDRRPPVGPWVGSASKDAKIPVAPLSHVEALGPESLVTADIPTQPGQEAATRKAVEDLANKLADQIDALNHKADQYDGKSRP